MSCLRANEVKQCANPAYRSSAVGQLEAQNCCLRQNFQTAGADGFFGLLSANAAHTRTTKVSTFITRSNMAPAAYATITSVGVPVRGSTGKGLNPGMYESRKKTQ